MRVRELLPFIEEHQEVVIRYTEGGKAISGTAREIRLYQNQEEIEKILDKHIVRIFNHCFKMYIIVQFYKELNLEEMDIECE